MKQNKKSFRHESLQDSQSVLEILTTLTEGLEKGKLVLSDAEDEIILNPQGLLQLKLSATQDDNRFSFTLKWAGKRKQNIILKKIFCIFQRIKTGYRCLY